MSTFPGKISEIPNISVDRFDEENLSSKVYFLSHCHWDHMQGIDKNYFLENLMSKDDVYIYGSRISILFLEKIVPQIKARTKALSFHGPNLITVPNTNECLTVTLIPAGHCPGSVMFLFETKHDRILYTGDFRIKENDIKKFNVLHDTNKIPKKIDVIYLDTTFFNKSYLTFPSREDSTEEICKKIKSWIDNDPGTCVNIIRPAFYGMENLFIDIHTKLNIKIHIKDEKVYKQYCCIPDLKDSITNDAQSTRVHSCSGPCINKHKYKIIRPTAIYWKDKDTTKCFTGTFYYNVETFRVCYSSHSSFNEIKNIIEYLKPGKIVSCVVPEDKKEQNEMEALIDECLKTDSKEKDVWAVTENFGIHASSSSANNSPVKSFQRNTSFDEIFSSPVKKFRLE